MILRYTLDVSWRPEPFPWVLMPWRQACFFVRDDLRQLGAETTLFRDAKLISRGSSDRITTLALEFNRVANSS